MPLTNAEKQKSYGDKLTADANKGREYLRKERLRKLKHKQINMACIQPNPSFSVEMLCKLQHPFTSVVAGPTGCGKSVWVLRLIENVWEMIEPVPTRIWCCYREYHYPSVNFHEGLPELSDEALDGRQQNLVDMLKGKKDDPSKLTQVCTHV